MTHPLSKAMQTNDQRDWREVVEWARSVPDDVKTNLMIALHGSMSIAAADEALCFMAMGKGDPQPPLAALMEEASDWAQFASSDEHKAYAAACWNEMTENSRERFVKWMAQDAYPQLKVVA